MTTLIEPLSRHFPSAPAILIYIAVIVGSALAVLGHKATTGRTTYFGVAA